MIRKTLVAKMFLVVFAFSLFVGTTPVYAQADDDGPCPLPEDASTLDKMWSYLPAVCLFNNIKESNPILDIVRTIQDWVLGSVIEVPMHWIFGRSLDQFHYCVLETMQSAGLGCSIPEELNVYVGVEDCSDLQWNPLALAAGYQVPPPTNYRAFGTLAGITNSMMDATYVEPPPVNLAWYTRRVASKIPIVGDTAYAQYDIITKGAAFEVIFNIWEFSRNIAYGMLSIFMLVIGVMIMMRKQLDPRTSVTVQNALPRIVIAVILITFSYAIGAFAISMVPALVIAALQPIMTMFTSVAQLGKIGPMIMIGASVYKLIGFVGTGGMSMLLMIIAMIVLIVLLLWVLVRAYMAYIKIIMAIIMAPITFAWGAIPGNEKVTVDWFKQVGLNVIVIPAMMFFIGVAFLIGFNVQIVNFCKVISGESIAQDAFGQIGGFFNVIGSAGRSVMLELQVPMIMMSIFFFAGKLPKKLEEAIIGDKKRK